MKYKFKCSCGYIFIIDSREAKTIRKANFLANEEHYKEHQSRHCLDEYEYSECK